ncbi:MAG: lipoyl(octanoyl) transferase LipB [Pirellulales bacterium]
MPTPARYAVPPTPAVEAHLLGSVDFDDCLALQQRLVYETSGRGDGQITLLICEHPLKITVGRQGSRAHIQLSQHELTSRQIDIRWVNRGGGCLVHAPGQLAVYPIVPLQRWSFSIGEYLTRLQCGLSEALDDMACHAAPRPGRFGLWGHTGQVVSVAAAVKSWVTYYGAYVNVAPALYPFRWVQTDPLDQTPMSSLAADRRRPVRMSGIREALVRRLTAAWGSERYHIYTGHPLFRPRHGERHVHTARVG